MFVKQKAIIAIIWPAKTTRLILALSTVYFKNGTVKDFYSIKFWLAGYLNLSLGRSWKLFWTTLSKKKQILIMLTEKKNEA